MRDGICLSIRELGLLREKTDVLLHMQLMVQIMTTRLLGMQIKSLVDTVVMDSSGLLAVLESSLPVNIHYTTEMKQHIHALITEYAMISLVSASVLAAGVGFGQTRDYRYGLALRGYP